MRACEGTVHRIGKEMLEARCLLDVFAGATPYVERSNDDEHARIIGHARKKTLNFSSLAKNLGVRVPRGWCVTAKSLARNAAAYREWMYWGKPFRIRGRMGAELLILGPCARTQGESQRAHVHG